MHLLHRYIANHLALTALQTAIGVTEMGPSLMDNKAGFYHTVINETGWARLTGESTTCTQFKFTNKVPDDTEEGKARERSQHLEKISSEDNKH